MQHEAIPSELPRGEFDLSAFAKSAVLGGVLAAADDKGVMKERLMLAYECGHLTEEETRQWVRDYGLEAA
ncbi:MAG: hypothetical protein JKY36_05690 [Erythrobacter sp.]|nr:hypothetical protein [Erythrobacter sp.]